MNTARELTARLADLLRREHAAMAEFLVTLSTFDERKLWAELGYRSLFEFLYRELGLSKTQAHFRSVAARLARRCPEVIEPLRDGRLCMTSILEVSKVLTPENHADVLPRFFHRSKREAMEIVAELRPAEDVPRRSVVTPLRAANGRGGSASSGAPTAPLFSIEKAACLTADTTAPALVFASSAAPVVPAVVPAQLPDANSRPEPQKIRGEATPLTAELSRYHVTVSRRFLAKLEAARNALFHSNPGAGDDEILEAGLDLLLKAHEKRKGVVEKPRDEPPPSTTDHIPAHVRRAVWKRDQGRCQWKLDSGGICACTRDLHFAHVISRARGGPATIPNVRLLCAFHNQYEARLEFGDAFMDRFTKQNTARAAERRDAPPRALGS